MARAARNAVVAALFLAATAAAQGGSPADALAQARHDLSISEQVLARLTERVDAARSSPAITPDERQRLDEYLVRVRALVALNRERVRNLEREVAAQPVGTAGGPGAAQPVAAATEAERVAMLDEKLRDSLEAFDKLLLDEARKARTREAEAGSTNGGGGGSGSRSASRSGKQGSRDAQSDGGESTASDPNGGESKDSGTERSAQGGRRGATNDGSPGGPVNGREPGAAGPETATAPPPDVGDGNDDDIVARQIRKAAEAESDPELRKKLWDEYRKYKLGVSQGTNG
jgi:hypothetical protein